MNGKLWYFITNHDAPVPGERIIHVPHLGEDPIQGKSTIAYAREDLGMEMSRRNWGANFWFDGGSANGLLVPQQKLTPAQEAQAKISYREAKREGGDILMPFGFDYKKMSVDPADAEFIMSGNFSIATICRWFGLPLHKLSELSRATMNNIEHQAIELLQDTIHPIISKFEDEYTTKCYTLPGDYDEGGEEDVYMEFCMDEYQRADSQAMAESFRTGIQNGYFTPNEVRQEMNRNRVEGGDRLFIQQNMMPLDSVDKILIQKQQKPAQPLSKNLRDCVRELAELAELEYKTNGNGNGHH
jgi:HK97 family phage portal protein